MCTHKKRGISPKGNGKGKESKKKRVTVAIVYFANHRPRTTSGKLLQFETSMNTYLQRRKASDSHIRVWREQNQRQISICERDRNRQQKGKISKCTTVRPNMYSVDRRARRVCKAQSTQTSQEALHKTNFSRSFVTTKAKNTATGLVICSKERLYTVDSGAPLHVMGLSSLNCEEKETI